MAKLVFLIALVAILATACHGGYSSGKAEKGVFLVSQGRYTFDYNKAVAACKSVGAKLASLEQLNVAYKAGMNQCSCGWTTDKKAHYPITQKKSLIWQCGGSKPGVRTCGWQKTWNAYCFRKPVEYSFGKDVEGVFLLSKGRYTFNYDQAAAACKSHGAQLASLAQLNVAYKEGMNQCSCGWTTDKKAHYPITQKKSLIWQCGGSKPGVRTCGWQKTWNAYCYKKPVGGYKASTEVKGVFLVSQGRYTFDYNKAVAACESIGANLASLSQLNVAYKAGMNQCSCGWTTDKKAHYPITEKKSLIWQCGGSKPGVRTCGWQKTWNAYCYRKEVEEEKFVPYSEIWNYTTKKWEPYNPKKKYGKSYWNRK